MTFWDVSPDPGAKTLYSHCRGLSAICGQETRTHMPQLRVPMNKVLKAQPYKYLENKKTNKQTNLQQLFLRNKTELQIHYMKYTRNVRGKH